MKNTIIIGIVVAALAVAYYALSPLFNVVEIDDEAPVVSSGFEDLSPEQQTEMLEIMDEANSGEVKVMEESTPQVVEQPEAYPIMETRGHPASGTVRVIETGEGTIIRFEDFSTINGPQLHLYLSKDLEGSDFVDLGPIRGTRGNINYVVPNDIDISEYRYVMHWCVPFSVLFNYAEISQ